MNKTLSKVVLTIIFSLASLSATAEYTFSLLDGLDGGSTYASSINDLGQIVGYSVNYAENVTIVGAILWNNSVATDLGTLGGDYGNATSINNLGQIVGYSWDGSVRATLWNNGVATDLNPQGRVGSEAFAINNSGQVVGYSNPDMNSNRATVWNNGVATDLYSQSSSGNVAWSINNLGQIVGVSNYLATIWNNGVATQLTDLQSLISSFPTSINDSGQIVGYSWNPNSSSGSYRAVLWNNGVATDLNSFLSASVQSEGWVLNSAADINNNGDIVGSAFNIMSGAQRGFLLQSITPVPEADTSAMLLTGLCVIGFMVRRRKSTQA